MTADLYTTINTGWPPEIPILTRVEAERATRRLLKKFGPPKGYRVRRCWISNEKTRGWVDRGWRRLVHDLSHIVHARRKSFAIRDHGGIHAALEREMLDYVLAHGWLTGKLRPVVRPKARPSAEAKLATIEAAIKRWATKKKRAETALKKLREKRRRIERAARGLQVTSVPIARITGGPCPNGHRICLLPACWIKEGA